MSYYSFVAYSRYPVSIPDPLILLGEGVNTFTAVTDDLEGLKSILEAEGVEIREVHRLDGLESVSPESLLLPEEVPPNILGSEDPTRCK